MPLLVAAFVSPAMSSSAHAAPTAAAPRPSRLHQSLTRELGNSARFLDHGVLAVTAAVGTPHRYRVGMALGLLDHLTIGATAHWLPEQRAPKIAPYAALAFYRWRTFEIGAAYDRSLYPPPPVDLDPSTASFQRDAHWVTAVVAVGQAWLSGGGEFGAVFARERDPSRMTTEDGNNPAAWRARPGGGLFLRAGARRWGITASFRAPWVFAELALDVRFGVFEKRPRGGWAPRGFAADRDRSPPRR